MLNKAKFTTLFKGLCAIVDKEPSVMLISVYYNALKDLTDEEFEYAVNYLINSLKFHKLPLPAQIRECVKGNIEDRAILALQKVEDAIRRIGPYQSVVFDDPIIHAVINSFDGGWVGICSMTYDEWKFAKKDFIKLYKAFAANPHNIPEYPKKLIGIHEHNNTLNGYLEHIPSPIFVGNKEKAKQLYSEKNKKLKRISAIESVVKNMTDKMKLPEEV